MWKAPPQGLAKPPATHSNLDYQGFKMQFEKERPPSPFYFLMSTWSGTPKGCGLPVMLQARGPCQLYQVTEDVPHVQEPFWVFIWELIGVQAA